MSMQQIFGEIYRRNAWHSKESRSGGGSELARTVEIRRELPFMLAQLQVKTLLDAGCGDWNWMSRLDLDGISLYACDVVPEMIERDRELYGSRAFFFTADIVNDPLSAFPTVDLVLCRATLFHLSLEHVQMALTNLARCASYLLTTTHPNVQANAEIADGAWRRLNLQLAPFCLPAPLLKFYDGPGQDGCLALWESKNVLTLN